MSNNQQGLMKKLFLPTFTDAGSNETFQQSVYQAADDTHSEASTAVHDNRSHVKRQFHSSAPRSVNANRPPPFFASTRPVSIKQHTSEVDRPSEASERQPFGSAKTLSTVALARGVSVSSTDEGIGLDDNQDTNQSSSAYISLADQHAESMRIERDNETDNNQRPNVRTALQSATRGEMQWEEEATPEQTVFGKQLLFARKDPSALSDVLSTASEMGTVIEYNDKLAELENMEFHSPSPIRIDREKQEFHSPKDTLGRMTEKSGISMPVLDEVINKTNRDSEYDEKKGSEQEEDIINKFKSSHTTTLLSNAFKRIGTGIAHGSRVVMSAPTTPLGASRWAHSTSPHIATSNSEMYTKTQKGEAITNTSSSFLLRSPGSKAFELASSQPRDLLRPRFSSRNQGQSLDSRIDEDQPMLIMRRPHQTAFQIARSCFSYDAYDSAMDDMFEVSATDTDNDFQPSSYGSVRYPTQLEHPPILKASASWDAAGVSQVRSARSRPGRQRKRQELWDADSFETRGWKEFQAIKFKDNSEPAPDIHGMTTSSHDREDALNILACLVERGVSLKDREGRSASNRGIDGPMGGDSTSRLGAENSTRSIALSGVDELRDLVLASNIGENSLSYERRLVALDELLRSHEYAQEMRRASESALTWLKTVHYCTEPKIPQSSQFKGEDVMESDNETLPEGLDLSTAKALLRSSQLKVKEKCDLAEKLNEELAKCRAEIGRLRSSSQATTFKSPDRSILDEIEDALPEDDTSQNKSFDTASTPIVAVDDSGFVEASFLMNEYDPPGALFPDQRLSTVEGASMAMYQKALDDANEEVRKLQAQLHDAINSGNKGRVSSLDKGIMLNLPESSVDQSQDKSATDEENYETDWSQLSSGLPPPPDHDLHNPIVNAVLEQWSNDPGLHNHLLDWMEAVLEGGTASNIPPLMISNLESHVRDGFVMHVLPQLLRRADIRVDVQTRTRRVTAHDLSVTVEPSDPFRSKQPVFVDDDVGSTTHSTTTSITGNGILARKRTGSIGGAKRPTHYDGISRVSYDEIAEDGIGADQPHGLMSALGGALGGLLARRRPPHLSGLSDGPGSPLDVSPSAQSAAMHVAAAAEAFGSNEGKPVFLDEGAGDDQPYHRVVSAPAGRIGVTFVQYRGHAMVSDVAPDSPLAGWIFPSDILIAIDELPVSGMPVRDIIKVLMDRKQKQRALRVISSHAMNELSLNTSLMMDSGN